MIVETTNDKKIIRIGSRASKLAIAQTQIIADEIMKHHPDIQVEIVTMDTTGDKIQSVSLDAIGGKGLFIKELNQALADGSINLAVHSLKDMPMDELEIPILAYSKREDPRDVLVLREDLKEMPERPLIGTSSKRRRLQMQKIYEDARFQLIRGNVHTRLRKLQDEQMDGTILAAAGLKRVGMDGVIARYFSVDEMIPSAGQGILAVQGQATEENLKLAALINDEQAMYEAVAERAFVRTLDGGCTSPVAAHGQVEMTEDGTKKMVLRGLYYEEDGTWFTDQCEGNAKDAEKLGVALAEKMRNQAIRR